MPPILESNHDLGVLILLRCFLGPLAINLINIIFYIYIFPLTHHQKLNDTLLSFRK